LLKEPLLAGCAVIAAGVLAGCSESRISGTSDTAAARPNTEARAPIRPAKTEIVQRFATAALDDRQLGGVRGGLNTGSGIVVNFSFQEATYVNHNLTQSIIVPTMTISPGSTPAAGATVMAGASAIAGARGVAAQTQVSAPTQVVQSVVNNGMTSVVSSLGAGGVTNHISNSANNQLVQQMITANIGITGLGQAIQQGVASTIMSRVQAANAQFR
jgi:hypothetical protein